MARTMDQVAAIPGLYISDAIAATTRKLLVENGITHILTIAQPSETPVPAWIEEEPLELVTKKVMIDDDPMQDILAYLGDVCAWIDAALDDGKGRVLMHCRFGQSRSGAFLVGYIMKKLDLKCYPALQLARESRAQVEPNPGFEKQLRIWEFVGHEVFVRDEKTGERRQKPAYTHWKKEMDLLRSAERDRGRQAALAAMAARVAARRKERERKEREEDEAGDEEFRRQWENVEQQERMWNERLMRGQVGQGAEETGDAEDAAAAEAELAAVAADLKAAALRE